MMYEYSVKIMVHSLEDQEAVLNRFGANGWRLVTIILNEKGWYLAYLERPIKEQ